MNKPSERFIKVWIVILWSASMACLGAGVSLYLAGYSLGTGIDKAIDLKDNCEYTLPRNISCQLQYAPGQ